MLVDAVKGLCFLITIAALGVGAFVWLDNVTGPVQWWLRVLCPIALVLAAAPWIKLERLPDPAFDYLREFVGGSYFDRSGFCFGFRVSFVSGIWCLEAYFQNNWSGSALGRIALRPARDFFCADRKSTQSPMKSTSRRPPSGLPASPCRSPRACRVRNKSLKLGLGRLPAGYGKAHGYQGGVVLRSNSNFGNSFGTALAITGALTGHLVFSTPATVTLHFPENGLEEIPGDAHPEVVTFWKLGDPPLPLERIDPGTEMEAKT